MLARSFYRYNTASPWQGTNSSWRFPAAPRLRVVPRFPALNVWTNEDGAMATVRLPGVNSEDLDISVKENSVTIAGSRSSEELPEEANYLRRELRSGDFSRTFQLPFNVDANKVEATFENGILHLSVPRAEADKPRKIAVKSA